jgi:hypothetical protein
VHAQADDHFAALTASGEVAPELAARIDKMAQALARNAVNWWGGDDTKEQSQKYLDEALQQLELITTSPEQPSVNRYGTGDNDILIRASVLSSVLSSYHVCNQPCPDIACVSCAFCCVLCMYTQ